MSKKYILGWPISSLPPPSPASFLREILDKRAKTTGLPTNFLQYDTPDDPAGKLRPFCSGPGDQAGPSAVFFPIEIGGSEICSSWSRVKINRCKLENSYENVLIYKQS